MRLKNKGIRERTKKLKEQMKIENSLKVKWNHIMKLKPKKYKNIPDKTKKDIKFNFEHEKAQRELMEDNLEEIKKKSRIEYLEILNEKTKEKLIWLWLDKKILDSFENDEYIGDQNTEEIEDNPDSLYGLYDIDEESSPVED